ncbi:MAG: class I SAM-dependent methyltransferase [Pseudomonadota bacterium]
MRSDLNTALAIQAKLADIATELARQLDMGHHDRDATTIRDAWRRIDQHRGRLSSLYRSMRKVERKPRAGLSRKDYEVQRTHTEGTKALQRCLRLWDRIEDMVMQHIDPVASPIKLKRDANASDPMLSMLHVALHRLANPNAQTKDANDYGCFADIPLSIQPFEGLMLAAYRLLVVQGRADTARFLDIGCGGGTKVFAASHFFPICDGLDYDPAYVAAGQRTLNLLNTKRCSIFEADGITFDGYDAYDVIYFYRPLRDDEMLAKLERRVFDTARPGTVVIALYDHFLTARAGIEAAKIIGPIFIAGVSQADADALHAEAERTSPSLLQRARHQISDPGFWTPILEATRYNPRL